MIHAYPYFFVLWSCTKVLNGCSASINSPKGCNESAWSTKRPVNQACVCSFLEILTPRPDYPHTAGQNRLFSWGKPMADVLLCFRSK